MVTQKDKYWNLRDSFEIVGWEKADSLMQECNLNELENLFTDLKVIQKKGFRANLYKSFELDENIVYQDAKLNKSDISNKDLISLAKINLEHDNNILSLKKDLITLKEFLEVPSFILLIYHMDLRRKLEKEDIKKIYQSQIDQKLVFQLYDFDMGLNLPEGNNEFFQKLKKTNWKNRKTKNFFQKLQEILQYLGKKYIPSLSTFRVREEFFILSLAACSAVNNNREEINRDDVITAYKTYFKLLKTDLPSLMEEQGVDE